MHWGKAFQDAFYTLLMTALHPGKPDELAADVLRRTAWSNWHSGAPAGDLLEGKDPRPGQVNRYLNPAA